MVYTLWLKGIVFRSVVISDSAGKVVYVLKRWSRISPHSFTAVTASGTVLYRVDEADTFDLEYVLREGGKAVGRVGWDWNLGGFIEVPPLPPVRRTYDWGLVAPIGLETDYGEIGRLELLRGWRVRATLTIDRAEFDVPALVVGCALIFREEMTCGGG